MAYPITFGEEIFKPDPDNPQAGQKIDAYEGDSPGNFGWITWNPAPANDNATYVEDELQTPQMSLNDFTDVEEPDDHYLSIGDAVSTKPGVSNSAGIDDQLLMLARDQAEIIIPVYENNPGTGENAYYRISHFARVRVDQICLPRNGQTCDGANKKQIKATFLGYVDEICPIDGSGPTPGNHDPVAEDDSVEIANDTMVVIDVLDNDTDADGDTLLVINVTELTPFKGTLQLDGDGRTIRYQPKANDTGSYQFTYTIIDNHGGSATATVTITVANE